MIFMDYRSDKLGKARTPSRMVTICEMVPCSRTGKIQRAGVFSGNGLIRFDTLFDEMKWEVFSVYITEADSYIQTTFSSDKEYLISGQDKGQIHFDKDIDLSEEDQILTLSTCTYEYDDARFVVHIRGFHKSSYSDSF